jgi:hypothetical protein
MSFFMDCEIMPEERRHGHELEIRRLEGLNVARRAADHEEAEIGRPEISGTRKGTNLG